MAKGKLDGVTFDLSRVSARAMNGFFKAAKSNDIETLAGVFAQVVTGCPAAWGDPADPETYLALPFYGAFQDVLAAMVEAAQDNAKN